MNPFKIMREFERIFDDDINYHNTNAGSFISTGRDEEDFMREFFGIKDFINDPSYHEARFGRPNHNDFFHHRIDRPEFFNHQNSHAFSNNSNFPNNQASHQVRILTL